MALTAASVSFSAPEYSAFSRALIRTKPATATRAKAAMAAARLSNFASAYRPHRSPMITELYAYVFLRMLKDVLTFCLFQYIPMATPSAMPEEIVIRLW